MLTRFKIYLTVALFVDNFTGPSLSWDTKLKLTNVEMKLLTDIDTVLYLKNAIRCDVSTYVTWEIAENNPFLSNCYSSKFTSHILYVDATTLFLYVFLHSSVSIYHLRFMTSIPFYIYLFGIYTRN